MTAYRWLLMDADNTLFDFDAAEDYALSRTLVSHNLSPTPELKAQYQRINSALWADFDQGRISQEALGPKRPWRAVPPCSPGRKRSAGSSPTGTSSASPPTASPRCSGSGSRPPPCPPTLATGSLSPGR